MGVVRVCGQKTDVTMQLKSVMRDGYAGEQETANRTRVTVQKVCMCRQAGECAAGLETRGKGCVVRRDIDRQKVGDCTMYVE